MLTQDQLAFVREYFVDVNPTAAAVRSCREGVAATSFAAECMDHPAVKSVIGAVWQQIMGDIAVYGRAIHHPLPEQGGEQSFILFEVGRA